MLKRALGAAVVDCLTLPISMEVGGDVVLVNNVMLP